ncbi:metallophosphoesterase [Aquibacillus kalidii]|uniref:metallophosphoesterase n=1 Tax=Aquibacillus kalidii TaxID=2762597 RepID=UPI001F3A7914|nr:metallophosphoesterase [Aquibacillus kalidii]
MNIKQIIKNTSIFSGILLVLLLTWGLTEPYFINIEEEKALIPNLPDTWDGERVAVVGDFQIGMWLDNTNTVERVVKRLVQIKPKAVLLLGDFVYHPIDNQENEISEIKEILKPLVNSKIPLYTVLGNHDFAMDKESEVPNEKYAFQLSKELNKMGIDVLNNDFSVLSSVTEKTKKPLYLVGIGPTWPNSAEPTKVFKGISKSAARIVMMHNPETYTNLKSNTAPLAIAGHTHGSQVRIPLLSKWFYNTFLNEEKVHFTGWIDDLGKSGNNLYVNPGIGFSNFPIRINCPPEITIFNLRKKT